MRKLLFITLLLAMPLIRAGLTLVSDRPVGVHIHLRDSHDTDRYDTKSILHKGDFIKHRMDTTLTAVWDAGENARLESKCNLKEPRALSDVTITNNNGEISIISKSRGVIFLNGIIINKDGEPTPEFCTNAQDYLKNLKDLP